jgi:histidinol phosphatase-like enzyme
MGSKTEILTAAIAKGYSPDKVLMIGDAPGDMKAAQSVKARYFPINPGHEDQSWTKFQAEAIGRFFAGTYAGEFEAALIKEFEKYLPEKPSW